MWLIFKFLNRYSNIEMPIFLCPIVNTDTPNNSEIAKIYRGGNLYARSKYGYKFNSRDSIYTVNSALFKNYFRRSGISDKIIYQICSLINDMTNPSPPLEQNLDQTKVPAKTPIIDMISCLTKSLKSLTKVPNKIPTKVSNKDTIPGFRTHVINNVTLKRVQDIIDNLSKLKNSSKASTALAV
jgi:hypothetical protein